uniref:Hemocyanin subunit X n=1 Tax=Scutigera coleoptrata TaxID=29022 RepID=HCYX_SCUCO|nr:RecName: Full=Hemocyanin subunit X; Flags: Precursor [Scutigera coleoptrata]CAD24085.1 hemocyanin subunit X [Scutigera coleoptrata]
MKYCTESLILILAVIGCISAAINFKCPKGTAEEKHQKEIYDLVQRINRPLIPQFKEPNFPTSFLIKGKDPKEFFQAIGHLPKKEVFSLFDERHWDEAMTAYEYLYEAETLDDFIDIAKILYLHLNEDMFYYVFSFAVLYRKDTRNVRLPQVHDVYPDKFLKTDIINKIKQANYQGKQHPVIDATKEFHDLRNPVSYLHYFLEDIGMNSHHYHWHVMNSALRKAYPTEGEKKFYRKGELFYHMHHQMLNRYELERLSNGLPRCPTFENWDDPIAEGYASHLAVDRTGYRYTFRPDNLHVRDLPELTKDNMRVWRDRIFDAATSCSVLRENGSFVKICRTRFYGGLNILGNLIESNLRSINRMFYGNIHCYAHVIAARVTDPDGKYGQGNGVMYDVATSARDPLFYQWHKFLDHFFYEHLTKLPTNHLFHLQNPDVSITNLEIISNGRKNEIHTFWENDIMEISKGHSFTLNSDAKVKIQHLQHEKFEIHLTVQNDKGEDTDLFVRIFLLPLEDEESHELSLEEMVRMAVDIEKRVIPAKPGSNDIVISSRSIGAPANKFFGSFEERYISEDCNFHSHCGWPNYLLVPKGSSQGTPFAFVVMLTLAEDDFTPNMDDTCFCADSWSHCGSLFIQYPENVEMGFPFQPIIECTKEEFFALPNIAKQEVIIKFTGETKDSPLVIQLENDS